MYCVLKTTESKSFTGGGGGIVGTAVVHLPTCCQRGGWKYTACTSVSTQQKIIIETVIKLSLYVSKYIQAFDNTTVHGITETHPLNIDVFLF